MHPQKNELLQPIYECNVKKIHFDQQILLQTWYPSPLDMIPPTPIYNTLMVMMMTTIAIGYKRK